MKFDTLLKLIGFLAVALIGASIFSSCGTFSDLVYDEPAEPQPIYVSDQFGNEIAIEREQLADLQRRDLLGQYFERHFPEAYTEPTPEEVAAGASSAPQPQLKAWVPEPQLQNAPLVDLGVEATQSSPLPYAGMVGGLLAYLTASLREHRDKLDVAVEIAQLMRDWATPDKPQGGIALPTVDDHEEAA